MKRKAWHLLILIAAFGIIAFYSCSGEKKEVIPDYVLPKDTMVMIVADYHLIEAELTHTRGRGKDVNKLRDHYYAALFDRYNIDQETLNKNFDYYKDRLEELQGIYQDVVTRLSYMESEEKEQQKKE